jgi:DNA/RNA endonuclease G (NUC1)
MSRRFPFVLLPAALVLLDGCAARMTVLTRPATGTVYAAKQAGLTPEQTKFRDANCFMGCPVLSRASIYGPTDMVYRGGYVLQHSSIDKIPVWVAERVTAKQVSGSATRDDKFQPDPLLKPGARAELADYKRSGYDRGHQAPAGNQTRDAQLKAETFYLSNMCPQAPLLNQQAWRELEDFTRQWVKKFGTVYEITGPLFWDPKEDDPATATGTVQFKVIGKGKVAVPTHFFKVVIARQGDRPWQAIAFVMENRKYDRPYHFDKYIQSIAWIQKHTGLDFMPEMDLQEQRRLENQPSPMWQ